jgi:hypothetical protein
MIIYRAHGCCGYQKSVESYSRRRGNMYFCFISLCYFMFSRISAMDRRFLSSVSKLPSLCLASRASRRHFCVLHTLRGGLGWSFCMVCIGGPVFERKHALSYVVDGYLMSLQMGYHYPGLAALQGACLLGPHKVTSGNGEAGWPPLTTWLVFGTKVVRVSIYRVLGQGCLFTVTIRIGFQA